MAVATLQWSPHSGNPGSGAANNAGCALLLMAGTESDPKKQIEIAAFDATTDEHLWFQFRMPDNYASAPKVILNWQANAVANKCAWGARLAAITAADADTAVEHAEAAAAVVSAEVNTTEARRHIETTLEPNADSVAAGDFVLLLVYRDADGTAATDSLTVDAELLNITLQYTTT